MATAEELKAKGGEFLKAKQYDEAIDAYTMAIAMDGTNQVLYSNRSAAHLANGDAVSALSDGEKCLELKPDWPRGYTRKGQALHTLRRYDEAEETYKAGVAACPSDAGMKEKLTEIQKIKNDAAEPPPMGNMFGNIMGKLAGHPKFAQWMADPAMMQKIQLLQTNPQMGIQMCMSDPAMGEVLEAALGIRLGTPDNMPGMGGSAGGGAEPMDTSSSSSSSSSSAAAAEPEPPVPPKELSEEEKAAEAIKEVRAKGNAHYKAKEFAEALECYNEVFEKDPNQVSVLNNKAAVYMEMGDLDAAEKQCEEAIEKARELRPTPFDLIAKFYVRWGNVYKKRKDLGKAIEFWEKAQMEFQEKSVERLIKTTLLEKKKADKLAYQDPEKAKEAKERGNTAFRAQNWGEAIKEYEEAIKRDPAEASYHNNLAAALCKVMDFNAAKREVEKALELDEKYVKAWARKGDIECLMKEFHKAMESYQKGLGLEPDNKACKEGYYKAVQIVNQSSASMSEDEQKERAAHGMADPEIQMILADPMVRQVIQDLGSQTPVAQAAGQKALRDPVMGAKIQKLVAAGVLRTG